MYLGLKDSLEPDMSRMLSPEQAAGPTGRIPAAPVAEKAITQEHQNALAGIIECAACETPMLNAAGGFACPGNAANTEQPCCTVTVNAERLLKAVMTRLVAA